jgi:hypothetical protein
MADEDSCPFTQPSDWLNTDPMLAELADNGGFTLTSLPLPDSLLIDNGICVGGLTHDQRDVARPQGAACDIGAVEVQPDALKVYLPVIMK